MMVFFKNKKHTLDNFVMTHIFEMCLQIVTIQTIL